MNLNRPGGDNLSIEKGVTPRESFELHELLLMKDIAATKSLAMMNLVRDEELKAIMRQSLMSAKKQIDELSSLIRTSGVSQPFSSGTSKFGTSRPEQTFKPVQTSRFAASGVLDEVKDHEVHPNNRPDGQTVDSKGASI